MAIARGERISDYKLLRAFTAPRSVFEKLAVAEFPKWGIAYLSPLLLGIVINLVNYTITTELVDMAIAQSPVMTRLTETIIRTTVVVNVVVGLAIVPLLAGFWVALVASVYGFMTSQLVPLGRLYALAMWAALPQMTANYLTAGITARLLPPEQLQSLKGSITSLAFLSTGLPDWATALARAIDLPYLWFLVLLTIGYAVAVQRPVQKVVGLPLVLFGLHIVAAVVLS